MSRQFCTFDVDDLHCGVEVGEVQEVIKAQAITSVPRSRPVVAGLINLRGEIVTAIDLRRRLRLADRPDASTPMHVVIRNAGDPVSLLVDRIGEVVTVDDAAFEPPPPTLGAHARELVTGTYKLDDRLLLVLATSAAIATTPSADGSTERLTAQRHTPAAAGATAPTHPDTTATTAADHTPPAPAGTARARKHQVR